MCGVIGDIKPQFSIIGTQVDIAKDICRQTPGSSILISSQSYKKIVNKVNNFAFMEQDMTIMGNLEKAYVVKKRRGI